MPAPIPGYTLALFGLFARLPFGVAVWLWTGVLLAALIVTVAALRSLSGLPLSVVIAAVALADGWASLVTGQLVPVVIAAVVVCGWALERGRFAWAAVAAAVAMLDPHIGLAACAGLFILAPRTRLALLGCALVLAALSLVATTPAVNYEYFARALPAQVGAELAAQEQYSLSYLLHRLGVGDAAAIAAGNVWYVAIVGVAIALTRRLTFDARNAALIAFVPAAASVAGGPYVHLHQIAVAIPAALLMTVRFPAQRAVFAWATVLLAVPWGRFLDLRSPDLFVGVVVGLLVYSLVGASARAAAWAAVGAMVGVYGALIGVGQRTFEDSALAGLGQGGMLASTVWGAFVRAVHYPLRTDLTFAITKLPTLAGMALLAYGVVRCAGSEAGPVSRTQLGVQPDRPLGVLHAPGRGRRRQTLGIGIGVIEEGCGIGLIGGVDGMGGLVGIGCPDAPVVEIPVKNAPTIRASAMNPRMNLCM